MRRAGWIHPRVPLVAVLGLCSALGTEGVRAQQAGLAQNASSKRPPGNGAAPTPTGSDPWGMDEGGAWGGDAETARNGGLSLLDEKYPAPSSPAPTTPAGGSGAGRELHGPWRLKSGQQISFHCTGGVCVFSGLSRNDPPVALSPAGPGRWTGRSTVTGRSGSAGTPMNVTSVDEVVYEVIVKGDTGVVRVTTKRMNHGRPTDIQITRGTGGTSPSRPNTTALDGSRAGPYHEFAALCRVGWAWGLAKTSVGPADGSIAEHMRAAGEHMMMANRTTFAPLQAWPNWSARRNRLREMADRLLREPSDRYREQLAFDLGLGWEEMAEALAIQVAGERQHRENCDSHYARLGYHLCSGQQLLQVAEVEERTGNHDRAVRIGQEGRQQIVAAARELSGLRTVRLATGSCVDLSRMGASLSAATSAQRPDQAVAGAKSSFETAISLLAGVPAPPPRHEILGQWCYSMFLDQKDLDHPEVLCRIEFKEEGGWFVGRLVAGSCSPKKAESLLITPPPRGGQEILRVKKVGESRYEGQALVWQGRGAAELVMKGARADMYRTDRTSRDHRRLFRCSP